jgi:Zn-dependent protease with chaperone function
VVAVGGIGLLVWLSSVFTVATVRALRHDFPGRTQHLRAFGAWRRFCLTLWLGLVLAVQCILQWPQIVRANWRLGETVLLDELLILGPVVIPLLLMWAVEFELDWSIRTGGRHERWRLRLTDRAALVATEARHHLVLVLVPVLLLLATRDIAERWLPQLAAGHDAWLVYIAPMLAILLGFPWILRIACNTQRLPNGPLRQRLESHARRWRVGLRDILVWHTQARLVNAAATGLFPRFRYVFLTDGLLASLDERQIEAVFAHEAGHARLHHVGRRLLTVLLPVMLWQAAGCWQADMPATGVGQFARPTAWLDMIPAAAPGVAIGLYILITLGWYSRLLEHQADLWACCRLGESQAEQDAGSVAGDDAVAAYVSALERMAATGVGGRRQISWLHPSPRARIDFLLSNARNPRRIQSFQRRVRMADILLVLAAAAPLLLPLP